MIITLRREALTVLRRLGDAAAAILEAVRAAEQRRETLRELEQLDDAALRDIGITRADLPHATVYERRCPRGGRL